MLSGLNWRFSQVTSLRAAVARLIKLPIFWPLLMFGTSGLAVTVANIIWARHLPAATYAVIALCLTVWNSAMRLAPFGADLEVNRDNVSLTRGRIRHVAGTSIVTGVIAGAMTGAIYGLGIAVSISIAIAIAASGIVIYGSAALRARRNYVASLAAMLASNYVTLIAAIGTVVTGTNDVRWVVGGLALCMVVVLALTRPTFERLLRSQTSGQASSPSVGKLWPLLVITAAPELMATSDRLVTPLLLGFEQLAELSILLSLVGPPFRLLELSVSYTLLPELRAATGRRAAVRAIRHHAWVAAALTSAASIGMLLALGPLNDLLFGDKFASPMSLRVAVVIAGLVRVAHAFANASALALVTEDRLPRLAALGMAGAFVVVAGSVVGAHWGLQGVVYGSMLGWIFRSAVYAVLVRQALHSRA